MLPHNSSKLRAQYAHDRGESGRLASGDRAKTDARRARSYGPTTGLVPTDAPSDRPGRLPERDRLGRLDVGPKQPGRRAYGLDRGGGGRRASDHRLPARFSPLDELPRPRVGGRPARAPSRVARAAGAWHPDAGSARHARACFDADPSERAERHAGAVAAFMMLRRPTAERIGHGARAETPPAFRDVPHVRTRFPSRRKSTTSLPKRLSAKVPPCARSS